jgi:hypothetical protein
MFLGHFGVGFGLKRVAPRLSLGTLFLAAQFVDLLWPTLLLLGVERVAVVPGITRVTPLDFEHYPTSHSLLASVGWAVIFAAVFWSIRKSARNALICGLAVLSHWFLDLLVHRPDLPLYPGAPARVGLGAWNSLPVTLFLESAFLGFGVWLYARSTQARDRTGVWALWALVAFLGIIYASNVWGPPPPGAAAIAWVGQAQWLLVIWGYWIDRHRQSVV